LARTRREFDLRIEVDLLRLFDRIIVGGSSDAELLRCRFADRDRVFHIGPTTGDDGPATPADNQDIDLLFVGSNRRRNAEGLRWFFRNVYVPFLRSHGVRLAVAGDVCAAVDFDDYLLSCHGWPSGSASKLYARARLVIAPMPESSGVSMKTIEALGAGTCIVATPAVARGLHNADHAQLVVDMRADPQGAARAILDLLADAPRQSRLRKAARTHYESHHAQGHYFAAMDRALDFARCAAA
jgi:glycosyltransferase involved in cell wall biosynthesis